MIEVATSISMALGVALRYMAWWVGVYPGAIIMDEDGSSNDGEATSENSNYDDQYQVNNPLHDVPP